MTRRFTPGQIVICLGEDYYGGLIGAVGEVKDLLPRVLSMLADYSVHFPAHSARTCKCGKHTMDVYYMHDHDLKPLDDPDEGAVEEKSEALDFGFVV